MTDPVDPTRPALRIKMDDDVGKGRFANLAQVGSTHDSFVIDFAFMQGGDGWLLSRILLSPSHAKRFQNVLAEAVARHEQRFGTIDLGPTLQ